MFSRSFVGKTRSGGWWMIRMLELCNLRHLCFVFMLAFISG
ncbi:hypothetical protein V6Z11_A02G116000 [Gossypium hirsutum]